MTVWSFSGFAKCLCHPDEGARRTTVSVDVEDGECFKKDWDWREGLWDGQKGYVWCGACEDYHPVFQTDGWLRKDDA